MGLGTLRAATEGELEADLWNGDCRWRRRHGPWESEELPCSQPIHGFAGTRESIAAFIDCVLNGSPVKADV